MQIEVMFRKSVGTFACFFAGISAIIKVDSTCGTAGLLVVAFARGIMISALGAVSGGHLYGYLFRPKPDAAGGGR